MMVIVYRDRYNNMQIDIPELTDLYEPHVICSDLESEIEYVGDMILM